MKVVIQAGHNNTQFNIDPGLRCSTGAPNEASFTLDIANQVSGELRKRGFEVKQTDANANGDPQVTNVDWDLFLAIHYDADVYGRGGGFVAIPDPSVDLAHNESQRIANILSSEYFGATKIENHPERQNPNTKFYYMWKALSAKTPCVLIECGVGMHIPDDHQILNFNRSLVVEGIVRGICKAFNVSYQVNTPTPQPQPIPQPSDSEQKLEKAKEIVWSKRRTALRELRTLLPQ